MQCGLGERIRFLKGTSEKAQLEMIKHLNEKELLAQKVNRELEEKVKERTKIIEHKNNSPIYF